ncbi:hypothetical protein BJP27_24600 (plasmid) [Pseudomonas oryzihabitans]|nr:hypothetical protein BJP27_23950 [Pseudomonas psychrotolerans]APQ14752.1 hypothetical protein BJP27_24600 [Pseudomonas psychrotolerans]
MLHAVPEQQRRMARQVVMRGPNSIPCVVYRKEVLRTAETAVGGLPDMGGLGVLDSEDEPAYRFTELGEGMMRPCGDYHPQTSNVIDSQDGVIYAEGQMLFQIECKTEGAFQIKKHDRIDALPGLGFVIPYEVVGLIAPGSIPPYLFQYILEPRQDETTGI